MLARIHAFRMLSTVLVGVSLAGSALAAGAQLACEQASRCPAGLLSNVRSAVDTGCPCDGAAAPKAYARCWKPVVRGFVKKLGKKGFPKACRTEVGRVLGANTCGRSGFVLCRKTRKKGGRLCTIAKARKCKDVFPTGSGFQSCSDACAGLAALPFPSTKELRRSDLASLQPDPGDGTLTFAAAPRALDGVGVGNVIVAGLSPSTPVGLLRLVVAVQRSGQQLTLRTVQAPIQLAYAQLHVHGSHSTPIASSGATTSGIVPLADFGTKKSFNYILFDGDGDPETKDDQVAIDGEIGGGFDYDFALDFEWPSLGDLPGAVKDCAAAFAKAITDPFGHPPDCSVRNLLPEAKVTFVVHPQMNANANVHGAALLGYKKEIPLASQTLAPIPIGPLLFVPKADIKANLLGGASGQFSTGVHGSVLLETKVIVSSRNAGTPDYEKPVIQNINFAPNETKISLEAKARVSVAASLSLLLFDVTGPYATAEPYAEITANILQAPCWNLHGGIDATLGVKVESPELPGLGSVTLVDWQAPSANPIDLPLADGGCDAPPDADGDPRRPGSGPDAVHVAMPTYTPWSRTYNSAVDGSNAHTPGNAVLFSDLQRVIDGRYVRSGFGVTTLTKFDDAGTLTWARSLALDGKALLPLRVRSATDATLFVVSSLPPDAPIVLVKVAQDGSVVEARSYDVPADLCSVDVNAAATDGADGIYVAGECIGAARSFVLHVSGGTATLRVIGDIPGLRVNVVEPIGNDVFLAGTGHEPDDRLYAFRIGADGSLGYSKRYDGCPQAPDAIPSTAIVGSQGEVTIAGSGGAQRNALLLRLLPDGEVGFAKFPGFGFGLGDVFILDSLVELPITGYVAGGSSVHLVAPDPDDIPSAGLVRFDAVGEIIWAKRFTFGGPGAYSASAHVAVHLSDDGGVVAATLLADAVDPFSGGRLWAFKPFIKDGTIDYLPGSVTTTDLGIVQLPCSMSASDRPLTVDTRVIPSHAVAVTSTGVMLAVGQQTAN